MEQSEFLRPTYGQHPVAAKQAATRVERHSSEFRSSHGRPTSDHIVGDEDFHVARRKEDLFAPFDVQRAETFLRQFDGEAFARLGHDLQPDVRAGGVDFRDGGLQRGVAVRLQRDFEFVRTNEDFHRLVGKLRMLRRGNFDGRKMDGAVFDATAEEIDLTEEIHHEFGLRRVEDFVRRADLLDAAFVHHDDAVGQFQCLFLIVRDENASYVNFVVQAAEPASQLLTHFGVERAERLVEQQDFRLDGKGAGQGDALSLAAGKLMRIARGVGVELDELQKLIHFLADEGARRALAARADFQTEGDVVEDGHVTEERIVLEDESDFSIADAAPCDVLVVKKDRSAVRVGLFKSGDNAQERRLSGAGRAEKGHKLAGVDGQAHVVQGDERSETLIDIFCFDAHGNSSGSFLGAGEPGAQQIRHVFVVRASTHPTILRICLFAQVGLRFGGVHVRDLPFEERF